MKKPIDKLPMSTIEKRINTLANALTALNGVHWPNGVEEGTIEDELLGCSKAFEARGAVVSRLCLYLSAYRGLCVYEDTRSPSSISKNWKEEIERINK